MYIYRADTYCNDCGRSLRDTLPVPPGADTNDERTFDSDDFPKGPFSEEEESADTPRHCANCEVLLDCPLTEDGAVYVVETVIDHVESGSGRPEVLAQWWSRYSDEVRQAWNSDDTDALRDAVGAMLEREASGASADAGDETGGAE